MATEEFKKFEGEWTHVSDENFSKFLEDMGVGMVKRQVATRVKPTFKIVVNGDGSINITRKASGPMSEFTATSKLGVTKQKTPDGDSVEQTMTYEDGKLKAVNKPQGSTGKPNTVIREVDGDKMIMTMIVDATGTTAKRIFKKA